MDMEHNNCPQCGGQGETLGQLGDLMHLRCRQCGWTFVGESDENWELCQTCDEPLDPEHPRGEPHCANQEHDARDMER